MSFNREYQNACAAEAQRLRIAEGWVRLHRARKSSEFEQGRADRLAGKPCGSANGAYLDGWYSVPNPKRK